MSRYMLYKITYIIDEIKKNKIYKKNYDNVLG